MSGRKNLIHPTVLQFISNILNHRIIEYEVGKDLKDHPVLPFLAKAPSRQKLCLDKVAQHTVQLKWYSVMVKETTQGHRNHKLHTNKKTAILNSLKLLFIFDVINFTAD